MSSARCPKDLSRCVAPALLTRLARGRVRSEQTCAAIPGWARNSPALDYTCKSASRPRRERCRTDKLRGRGTGPSAPRYTPPVLPNKTDWQRVDSLSRGCKETRPARSLRDSANQRARNSTQRSDPLLPDRWRRSAVYPPYSGPLYRRLPAYPRLRVLRLSTSAPIAFAWRQDRVSRAPRSLCNAGPEASCGRRTDRLTKSALARPAL